MKAPKLTPEAIEDLRANVKHGSVWERYKDGRRVEVREAGLAFDLVQIRTIRDGLHNQRRTLRVAWVHINRTNLVQEYKQL